jgi:hypothetical protein
VGPTLAPGAGQVREATLGCRPLLARFLLPAPVLALPICWICRCVGTMSNPRRAGDSNRLPRATIHTAMKPPVGIRVIVALQSVAAAKLIVKAVDLLVEVSKGEAVEVALILRAVAWLIVALMEIVLTIGLWYLSPLARYFTLIFSTFSLLFAFPTLLGTFLFRQDTDAFIGTLAGVALSSWTLWYLFRRHVKAAFHATPPTSDAAHPHKQLPPTPT